MGSTTRLPKEQEKSKVGFFSHILSLELLPKVGSPNPPAPLWLQGELGSCFAFEPIKKSNFTFPPFPVAVGLLDKACRDEEERKLEFFGGGLRTLRGLT